MLIHDAVLLGAGLVGGAFVPSVGRKIKSFFVKDTTKVKAAVTQAATTAEKDVTSKL